MTAHHPEVVQHEAVELLGPRLLPLDHPVGDHDMTSHRVEDIDHIQPILVIQEVAASSEVVNHLNTILIS